MELWQKRWAPRWLKRLFPGRWSEQELRSKHTRHEGYNLPENIWPPHRRL